MAVTNFNTSNQIYRKLMGNGLVYRVPMFQRDYSWEDEEWDDLWQDILGLHENEMHSLEERGETIVDKLGSESVPDFCGSIGIVKTL